MQTLDDVMRPIVRRIHADINAGYERHRPCHEARAAALSGTVRTEGLPTNRPLIWNGSILSALYIVSIRHERLFRNGPNGKIEHYRVNPPYVAPPTPIGVLWKQPYAHLWPIPGLTPPDWQRAYPGFHYWRERYEVCLGKELPLGTVATLDNPTTMATLLRTLGNVYVDDLITKFHDLPSCEPWPAWQSALTCLQHHKPQLVFELIPSLTFSVSEA